MLLMIGKQSIYLPIFDLSTSKAMKIYVSSLSLYL